MRSIHDAIAWLESIYGGFTPAARLDEAAIEAAEARLGLRLPEALRVYYRRTGAHRELHTTHNQLVALERVDFANEHLVFYEENQGVVVWGIERGRLADSDPPVEQAPYVEDSAWVFHPEFSSISAFACAQGAWQAVQGGLPFVGAKQLPPPSATFTGLRERLASPDFRSAGLDAWTDPDGVFVLAGATSAALGARTAAGFDAASQRVGFPLDAWDYCTLGDEDDEP